MSFPIKIQGQIYNISMFINCNCFATKKDKNGVIEEINCISKTIKPCCNKCSLINPNKKASVISTERKTGY